MRFIWSLALGAWRFCRLAAAVFLLWATCPPSVAEDTNSSSRLDYPSFRIIAERNIFNANRSTRSARSGNGEAERQVRVESFTLLGTLGYEKGTFAFFDGTSSPYRKALKPGDTIAGYTIAAVGQDRIRLEADGKTVELPVGMQMRREDEGDWQLTARNDSSGNAAQTAAATESGPSAEKSEAGSGRAESDVLKRLMQKREQEINK